MKIRSCKLRVAQRRRHESSVYGRLGIVILLHGDGKWLSELIEAAQSGVFGRWPDPSAEEAGVYARAVRPARTALPGNYALPGDTGEGCRRKLGPRMAARAASIPV